VHGCSQELGELLDKIGPTADEQVIFVGDLVARGPDTPGVLRLARQFRSQCVLGNHEHRLLLAHEARRSESRGPRLGPSHAALLHQLGDEDWEQLRNLPLSLEFPDHNIRVVHAGVVPGVPLEAQQPWTLLHLRSLTQKGAPSDRFSAQSWAELYQEDPHIVFGHNAQAGLQLHPAATGLDTACVYGGALTALVLEEGQRPPPPDQRLDCLVSVASRARDVDYGPRPEKKPLGV
jgi:diadenosine tetraphosphatase ApaH/serine/threonine PP2A family protein phosphatase